MKFSHPGEKYFRANTWFIFLVIYAIYAIALTIEFTFIFTDEFYIEAFGSNKQSIDEISGLISADREQEWVNYPFALLVIFVPVIATTLVLYLGAIIGGQKISIKNLFKTTLKAQIIFAISYLTTVLFKWQGIIKVSPINVNDRFEYQSLLAFFNYNKIPEWLFYPLQCINLTELLHLFVLAYGYAIISKLRYSKAFGRVVLLYGSGLLFWMVLVVFIQIVL